MTAERQSDREDTESTDAKPTADSPTREQLESVLGQSLHLFSYRDENVLRKLKEAGYSDDEIADALGVCWQTISRWRREFGIDTLDSAPEPTNFSGRESLPTTTDELQELAEGIEWDYEQPPAQGGRRA